MREKEEAADYRYFEDPDLPLLEISEEKINLIRSTLPELPHEKFDRLCQEHNLSPYEAGILIEDLDLANYFEQAKKVYGSKAIINWVLRDIIGHLNDAKITIDQCKVTPEKLAAIVQLLESGKINNQAAKQVFQIVIETGKEPNAIVKEQGLEQIGSVEELEAIVEDIVKNNPDNLEKYKAGNQRLLGFFVGEAMKKTKGKANPQIINDLLKKWLD